MSAWHHHCDFCSFNASSPSASQFLKQFLHGCKQESCHVLLSMFSTVPIFDLSVSIRTLRNQCVVGEPVSTWHLWAYLYPCKLRLSHKGVHKGFAVTIGLNRTSNNGTLVVKTQTVPFPHLQYHASVATCKPWATPTANVCNLNRVSWILGLRLHFLGLVSWTASVPNFAINSSPSHMIRLEWGRPILGNSLFHSISW